MTNKQAFETLETAEKVRVNAIILHAFEKSDAFVRNFSKNSEYLKTVREPDGAQTLLDGLRDHLAESIRGLPHATSERVTDLGHQVEVLRELKGYFPIRNAHSIEKIHQVASGTYLGNDRPPAVLEVPQINLSEIIAQVVAKHAVQGKTQLLNEAGNHLSIPVPPPATVRER